jgi:hypothetical protein
VTNVEAAENNEDGDGNNAMETPQLSDISSFNPDDPQVRQIDIDTSSIESNQDDVNGDNKNQAIKLEEKELQREE